MPAPQGWIIDVCYPLALINGKLVLEVHIQVVEVGIQVLEVDRALHIFSQTKAKTGNVKYHRKLLIDFHQTNQIGSFHQ
jgi:hypothetical protein